jgi:hypothetical protein
MCNFTLVQITKALARKRPCAIEAALGIFLAIVAGSGANAGPEGKEVPRVAFLGFEFIDTSPEATARAEVERIRLLDDVLRQKLTASGHFEIVDIPPDTIKEIASGPTVSNCNGCQRKFAQDALMAELLKMTADAMAAKEAAARLEAGQVRWRQEITKALNVAYEQAIRACR